MKAHPLRSVETKIERRSGRRPVCKRCKRVFEVGAAAIKKTQKISSTACAVFYVCAGECRRAREPPVACTLHAYFGGPASSEKSGTSR